MERPELTTVNHYNVFPFNHGGSLGIRGLYKALSEWFDINIITFEADKFFPDEIAISKHVKVFPIHIPEDLKEIWNEIYNEYGVIEEIVTSSDLAAVLWYHKIPDIIEQVRKITENSKVVLAEHAFTWRIIKNACPDKHLWYRANNVEYDYKRIFWSENERLQIFLPAIYDIEKECCEECERVLAVSQLDIDRFMKLYKLPPNMEDKFIDIRSGYDTYNLKTVIPSQRKKVSKEYSNTGFFITSYAPYGQIAAENCISIAKEVSDIQIIIAGNIDSAFTNVPLPENVIFTGIISEEEKIYYLQHCDFALNLLEDGAGINVKMFEYFAFGIPVITTVHGARGISVTAGENCILSEKGHYVDDIRAFCNMSLRKKDRMAESALELLKKEYSWRSLGCKVAEEIGKMYELSISDSALSLEEIALCGPDETESYLPKRSFYIRCAGEYGRNCLEFMRSKGLKPKAFIDGKYSGSMVNGVPAISLSQFLEERTDEEIFVAISLMPMFDVTAELIALGVPLKNISLSWHISGQKMIHLSELSGCRPYYHDPGKWRREIIRRAYNRK